MYRAEQLDLLHLTLINLLDMVRDGEIDLVLEQDTKTDQHKNLFIEKLLTDCKSAELKKTLTEHLAADGIDFFREKNLGPFLQAIQHAANACTVVKLTVAVEFKEKDLREMAAVLSERLGKQVVLGIKVDHSLIGGAIIQHGSYLNDYSVKTQLEMYRSRWHKAVAEQK
jgi:ATP synthase F1 delta subunit